MAPSPAWPASRSSWCATTGQSAPAKRRAALEPWLETQLSRIPRKSRPAEDIRHTLAHRPGPIRFLEDGTLDLDTNPVGNQIRPIAPTRKNALFAGNGIGAENRAALASPVATWRPPGVNPVDCIADTLRATPDGHPRRPPPTATRDGHPRRCFGSGTAGRFRMPPDALRRAHPPGAA
jgi:hypothetical protein